MKKLVSYVVLISMIMMIFASFNVFAAAPQVKIIATETATGVDVAVKLSGDITGLKAFELYVGFDKTKLTYGSGSAVAFDTNWAPAVTSYATKTIPFIRLTNVTTVTASEQTVVSGTDLTLGTLSFTKIAGQTIDANTINQTGAFKPVSTAKYSTITYGSTTLLYSTTPTLVAHSFTAYSAATATPVVTATPEPTVAPTATPEPTVAPTATPEPTVAPTATPEPTVAPTATPEPTVAPTATPEPTVAPTATPEPTVAPTATPEPTVAPTATPETTVAPTATPEPTVAPTATPIPTDAPDAKVVGLGKLPIPPSWSGAVHTWFKLGTNNLSADRKNALTFKIKDSAGADVTNGSITATRISEGNGSPILSLNVFPTALAGTYKLITVLSGGTEIESASLKLFNPAYITNFDATGAEKAGKSLVVVAEKGSKVTVSLTTGAGEDTYVAVYNGNTVIVPEFNLITPTFDIDTANLAPGKYSLKVFTGTVKASGIAMTPNDTRNIYLAVKPAVAPVMDKVTLAGAVDTTANTVVMTAQALTTNSTAINTNTEYMFKVMKTSDKALRNWKVVQDYSASNTFTWNYGTDAFYAERAATDTDQKWLLQVYARSATNFNWVDKFVIIQKVLN